ncbi:hypothetical protein ACS0TY_010757 [Phlomoides rotata]
MAAQLDLLEERRLSANMKNAINKQRSERYYNKQVKLREFAVGDLVLRKVLGKPPGVLSPTWEGPYRVTKRSLNRAYDLEDIDGKSAQYPWNASHLKKYYQ